MKCTFIGVGSAFDGLQSNTSLLIENSSKSILLDCGFNSAHNFVRLASNPEKLDAVWISHFHGDHFFGIPFLLGYLFTTGREKDLILCGPLGLEQKITQLVSLAYPNLLSKLSFTLVFNEFTECDKQAVCGFDLSTCKIDHSASALALRVELGGCSLFYSGDGQLTEACTSLAMNAHFAVLEAYQFDKAVSGHSSVKKCLNFATVTKNEQVALVHLEPFVRISVMSDMMILFDEFSDINVFLPAEGQVVDILDLANSGIS